MQTPEEIARFLSLSNREREVIKLFSEKYSYKDIASKLHVSEGAVSAYFSRAYVKLGISELGRMDKLLILMETYFPMFSMDLGIESEKSSELIVAEEIIDILPPEEEESIQEDINTYLMIQKASLVTIPENEIQDNNEAGSSSKKPNKEKEIVEEKIGCWTRLKRAIFTFLILFFLLIVSVGYGYYEYQRGNLPIIETIPSWITDWVGEQLGNLNQFPTQNPISTITPESASLLNPQKTNTNTPTNNPTKTPTQVILEPMVELGDWYEIDGIAMRLIEFEVDFSFIRFKVEFWNKTNQTLFFNWDPDTHIFVIDNFGRRFNSFRGGLNNETIEAGERKMLDDEKGNISFFVNDFIYEPGVTDIYLLVENMSRIEKVYFHVDIGK